jgi:hypothetical protein
MFEQESHFVMDRLAANKLVIIQDQEDLLTGAIQVIDQAGQDRFRWCLPWCRQELRGLISEPVVNSMQGGDKIAQEPALPIVISYPGTARPQAIHNLQHRMLPGWFCQSQRGP